MLFVLLTKIHIVFLFQKLPKLIDTEVSNWLLVMEHFIHYENFPDLKLSFQSGTKALFDITNHLLDGPP